MNAEVIEFLYRRHYNYLFTVAYRLCDRWDMAEDIVQDGFIKILTCKIDFMDWHHARRYITGCIRNAAFERLGREARIRAMIIDALMNEEHIHKSICVSLAASISKLKSEMSRVILKEIYWHNRTRKEVATIYQIDKKTVSKKEQDALVELRKMLPAYENI